jgi:hypothetical protein
MTQGGTHPTLNRESSSDSLFLLILPPHSHLNIIIQANIIFTALLVRSNSEGSPTASPLHNHTQS